MAVLQNEKVDLFLKTGDVAVLQLSCVNLANTQEDEGKTSLTIRHRKR